MGSVHRPDASHMSDSRGYMGATIHNINPAHLLEKAVHQRIEDSYYWKEQCFGINEATLCDRAADLACIGGTYGQQKPTPFLCLALKLLQLLPERAVVLEYLRQDDFKYLKALAAFYVRLTFDAADVYKTLEAELGDYRKLKRRTREGSYALTYMDQFIDDLLTKDRVCGTSLRRLPARTILEDLGQLEERVSPLGEELEELDHDDEEGQESGQVSDAEDKLTRSENGETSERRNGSGRRRSTSYSRSRSRSRSSSLDR